jgi:hypothetical protein
VIAKADFFLFDADLLAWLLLAFGGAMVVGNVAALIRPPAADGDGPVQRPPTGRTLVLIGLGAIATIWALASLIS